MDNLAIILLRGRKMVEELDVSNDINTNNDFEINMNSHALSILDALGFGVTVIDSETHEILYFNKKVGMMSGFSRGDLIGKKCHTLLCPAEEGACPILNLNNIIDNSERALLTASKKAMPIIKTVIPVKIENREYLIESFVDNTERNILVEKLNFTNLELFEEMEKTKKAQDEIAFLAYHDHLTGLPNALLMRNQLDHSIQLAKRSGKLLAVLFMDLDDFKLINDSMGHATGDQLLIQVANRVKNKLRKSDIISRIGGDEFVVILENINDTEILTKIAEKIKECFRQPFIVSGRELYITTSIGISVFPGDGETADTLIKNADIAMYKAKEKGRNQWSLCTANMKTKAIETMNLGNQLYRALDNNEFELYYQPQISCSTHKIVGLEALIRWRHPKMGMVQPGKFIPIAEHTGLIHAIGDWVLKTACRQNKYWQDMNYIHIPIAVNLSMRQLQNPNIVGQVTDILAETGLKSKYLELEITESIALHDIDYVIETLALFRSSGISIAIDDFGTEYSSLNYLKQLPVDRIKIAMPFIQGIEDNQKDEAITKAILVLAKSMGLKVVAEGVETLNQFSFLSQRMCDDVQGYYFYKPMPASEVEKLFKNQLSER